MPQPKEVYFLCLGILTWTPWRVLELLTSTFNLVNVLRLINSRISGDFCIHFHSFYFCRNVGANLSPAPGHETGAISVRHHLRRRTGASGSGSVHQRCRGSRGRTKDRDLQPQTSRIRFLGSVLGILGSQYIGQGTLWKKHVTDLFVTSYMD